MFHCIWFLAEKRKHLFLCNTQQYDMWWAITVSGAFPSLEEKTSKALTRWAFVPLNNSQSAPLPLLELNRPVLLCIWHTWDQTDVVFMVWLWVRQQTGGLFPKCWEWFLSLPKTLVVQSSSSYVLHIKSIQWCHRANSISQRLWVIILHSSYEPVPQTNPLHPQLLTQAT